MRDVCTFSACTRDTIYKSHTPRMTHKMKLKMHEEDDDETFEVSRDVREFLL